MENEGKKSDSYTPPNSILGIITSLIASFIYGGFIVILGLLKDYRDIIPNFSWIILIITLTMVAIFFIRFDLQKRSIKAIETVYIIVSSLLYLTVLLFVVHNIFLLSSIMLQIINHAESKTMYNQGSLLTNYRIASFIAMSGCSISVIRLYLSFEIRSDKRKAIYNDQSILDSLNSLAKSIEDSSNQKDTEMVKKIDEISEEFQRLRRIKGMNSAMTSTIIPFQRHKNDTISTYLIANNAYPDYTWMFPGGHVYFEEHLTPESVAKSRTYDEAGIETTIVDIYNSFDVRETEELKVDNMTVFYPPHYLNLFRLDDKARCYREYGHEYHIDAVYVAEISSVNIKGGNSKRIEISLPKRKIQRDELKAKCIDTLLKYYNLNKVMPEKRKYEIEDYVIEMLYCAFNDYVKYLDNQKESHE